MTFIIDTNFQTPPVVAAHMAAMAWRHIPNKMDITVLEPTPGTGNLVGALNDIGFQVFGPGEDDFWDSWAYLQKPRYNAVVLNPPFNPVKEMELFVLMAMEKSDIVVALLPWTYIINSERRLKVLEDFGLVSVTWLPRKTFPGCRVQACIVELNKKWLGITQFKSFSW